MIGEIVSALIVVFILVVVLGEYKDPNSMRNYLERKRAQKADQDD